MQEPVLGAGDTHGNEIEPSLRELLVLGETHSLSNSNCDECHEEEAKDDSEASNTWERAPYRSECLAGASLEVLGSI